MENVRNEIPGCRWLIGFIKGGIWFLLHELKILNNTLILWFKWHGTTNSLQIK